MDRLRSMPQVRREQYQHARFQFEDTIKIGLSFGEASTLPRDTTLVTGDVMIVGGNGSGAGEQVWPLHQDYRP